MTEGLAPHTQLELAVPIHSLFGRSVSPQDAFVLSRLGSEKMTVSELLCVCPMPQGELLGILRRLVKEGLLATVAR